jgi:hypothetical protein
MGAHSNPSPERGRSAAFAPALRRGKCCRVGGQLSGGVFWDHDRELTPTRLALLADLPLVGQGNRILANEPGIGPVFGMFVPASIRICSCFESNVRYPCLVGGGIAPLAASPSPYSRAVLCTGRAAQMRRGDDAVHARAPSPTLHGARNSVTPRILGSRPVRLPAARALCASEARPSHPCVARNCERRRQAAGPLCIG